MQYQDFCSPAPPILEETFIQAVRTRLKPGIVNRKIVRVAVRPVEGNLKRLLQSLKTS